MMMMNISGYSVCLERGKVPPSIMMKTLYYVTLVHIHFGSTHVVGLVSAPSLLFRERNVKQSEQTSYPVL